MNTQNKKITNFAIKPDVNTLKQFENCIKEDFVISASLMPDAHSGYVAPIGSVIITKDYIVPAWVGYDIGCGMIACKFSSSNKNLVKEAKEHSTEIYNKINEIIPMGSAKYNHIQNVTENTKKEFKKLLEKFKSKEYDESVYKYIKNNGVSHLGTLGSGNHFIELSINKEENELWVIIHSGSRGIGHKVAETYMKKASNNEKKFEETYPLKDSSIEGKEYLNILDFGLEFAFLNRIEMAEKVNAALKEILKNETLTYEIWTNKNHNHAIYENGHYTHRKGATPAKKGEFGVIPANMRDGCFLVEGLGNKEFLESSSHGAGRIMSRLEAKKQITMSDFKTSMIGIIGTINEKTIDEAPDAYKNIYDVMEMQKKSVKIIQHLKPIINWKG